MSDWLVKVYDKSKVIDAWVVYDGTEGQVFAEADLDVRRTYPRCDGNWSMTEVNWLDGGSLSIELTVTVHVEMHPEAVHDVIDNEVKGAYLIDTDAIEEEVRFILLSHLLERNVSESEIEVFEGWLDEHGYSLITCVR